MIHEIVVLIWITPWFTDTVSDFHLLVNTDRNKMATSAKMSFNYYQNGKYGTVPQNPGQDMEATNDMHLKMSKKIAQLTKVQLNMWH